MTSYTRIAAVTGSNKGIGFACIRQIALQYPTSSFNNGPLLIYLTSRDKKRGEDALKAIHEDEQLKKAKALQSQGGLSEIKYLQLDIDSSESIEAFTKQIQENHPEGIDMVINNAGVALDGFNAEVVKKTFQCNYYGTMQLTEKMLTLVRDGGRIVNIASMLGVLGENYSDAIKNRFKSVKAPGDVTKLMQEYQNAVEKNSYKEEWPESAYAVSKAGVISMTRTMATINKSKGSSTLLNSCCPGYVNTDMTKGRGYKTVDEGAMTPVLLALGDIKGSNGDFWQSEKKIEWIRE